MKYSKIILVPDPRLEQVCDPVDDFSPETREHIQEMKQLMLASGGIGLAASQVGWMQRVFIMNHGRQVIAVVNPVLKRYTGTQVNAEGCLSIPDKRVEVLRPRKVEIEAFDENGKNHILNFSTLEAACALHELDHLNGITILSRNNKQLGIP